MKNTMPGMTPQSIQNGQAVKVVGGTHAGKAGIVRDMHVSKTGAVTITVIQAQGERFKTLAKNVVAN
jgi:ribosomal protein S4E